MTDYPDLLAKAKAATPGPWGFRSREPRDVTLKRPHWEVGVHMGRGIAIVFGDTEANAAFIAAASPDVIIGLVEERERLEKALKPFAEFAERYNDIPGVVLTSGDCELWQIGRVGDITITVGDLRAARAALETERKP